MVGCFGCTSYAPPPARHRAWNPEPKLFNGRFFALGVDINIMSCALSAVKNIRLHKFRRPCSFNFIFSCPIRTIRPLFSFGLSIANLLRTFHRSCSFKFIFPSLVRASHRLYFPPILFECSANPIYSTSFSLVPFCLKYWNGHFMPASCPNK